MVLDELFPQEGNSNINSGVLLTIKSHHRGMNISFICFAKKLVTRHGLNGILVEFPENLNYMRRRDTFRVSPPAEYPLQCRLKVNNTQAFWGQIVDLSLTGMAIRFNQNMTEDLEPQRLFEKCEIILPSHITISLNFMICHLAYLPIEGSTVEGGEFKNISNEQQRRINQTVTDIQKIVWLNEELSGKDDPTI